MHDDDIDQETARGFVGLLIGTVAGLSTWIAAFYLLRSIIGRWH